MFGQVSLLECVVRCEMDTGVGEAGGWSWGLGGGMDAQRRVQAGRTNGMNFAGVADVKAH